MPEDTEVKRAVRERYARHAEGDVDVASPGCCGDNVGTAGRLGYSADELAAVPDGADLGLGCGNPLALLDIRPGETVVDLGSGGGIDCFVAGRQTGPEGRVIGVDMTPEMVHRARQNARAAGAQNVEFRLGEVEHVPVADATADVVISNCVINLVPDKRQAFSEALRILKPGGRLSVSDIVVVGEVPVQLRDSVDAYVACLSGAIMRDRYLRLLSDVGFEAVVVTEEHGFDPDQVIEDGLVKEFAEHADTTPDAITAAASAFHSIRVQARRPLAETSA